MSRKIRFDFVGDPSQLDAALTQLRQNVGNLGDDFQEAFEEDGVGGIVAVAKNAIKAHPALAAMAAAATAVGGALVVAAHEAIELGHAADAIAKQAKQIGSSAEEVQTLSAALAMGGVDAGTADAAMAKLNLRLAEAAEGGGPAVDVLKKLGLNAKELQELPLPERFAVLADRMDTLGTQGEKTAAAVKLMEEGGIRLLSAFEGGGDAIRESSEQIKAAGVISNETAAQGEGMADAIALASRQFSMMKNDAIAPLIPVITVTVEKLGDMFQILGDTGVLESTAKAVAFVAEKFLGLTDEVERFKEETSEASAVQNDSSADLERFREEVEKYTAIVGEAEARQKDLEEQIRLMPWRDHTKNLEEVARIEEHLNALGTDRRIGDVVGARQQLRTWTGLLAGEEERLGTQRQKGLDDAAALADEEKRLEDERKAAVLAEQKREERRKAYRAAAEAATKAAIAQVDSWSSATDAAEDARLDGLDALIREEERLTQAVLEEAQAVMDAGALSADQKVALFEDAEKRIEAIAQEYKRKKLDLIDEESAAWDEAQGDRVEAARQAALARGDADFKYWQSVQENSRTDSERLAEKYAADMEVVSEVTQQIQQVHEAVFGAILDVAQQVFNEKAAKHAETSDRIAEIDQKLGESITAGQRKRLEAEKARLEEQAEMEKAQALESWKRQKALSIVNASIATALAVIQALATAPNIIVGAVLAVAAGITGAASIAAIASEQPPQLHSGGMIPAMQGSAGASDEVMIRARRGEAVLSPQGVAAAGGEAGVSALNRGAGAGGGTTVNLIRVGPRTTEAIMHDTLRVPSSNLSRALGGVRPRVGRHDPRSRKG